MYHLFQYDISLVWDWNRLVHAWFLPSTLQWLHISLFGHVMNERFLLCKHDTKSSCHTGVEQASFPLLTSPNLFWVDVMWKSMVYIVNGFQVNILYAQTISWFFWSDLGPVQLIFKYCAF